MNKTQQNMPPDLVSIGKYRKRSRKPLQVLNRNKTKLFMILIPVTAVFLSAMALFAAHGLKLRTKKYEQQAADLQVQIEEETERAEELKDYQDYVESDDFAELYARSHLGLLRDNEISIRGE